MKEISILEVVHQTGFEVIYGHPGCRSLHPEDSLFEPGSETRVPYELAMDLLKGKPMEASQVRQLGELSHRFKRNVLTYIQRGERIQSWERETGKPYSLSYEGAFQPYREDLYAQLANEIAQVIFGDSILPDIGAHYLSMSHVRNAPISEHLTKLADKERVRDVLSTVVQGSGIAESDERLTGAMKAFERRVDRVLASDKHPWLKVEALVKWHQRLSQRVTDVLYPSVGAIRELGFESKGEKRTWPQWSPGEVQQLNDTQPVSDLIRSIWMNSEN